jgi:hypothetical protein
VRNSSLPHVVGRVRIEDFLRPVQGVVIIPVRDGLTRILQIDLYSRHSALVSRFFVPGRKLVM